MSVILIVLIAVAIIALFISKNKKLALPDVAPIAVDRITMELLISFFKKSDVLEKLKSDKKLIAVAIKEKSGDNFNIVCCLFDTEKNEVASGENSRVVYTSKELSEDVKEQFGDKDMLVLQ